MRPVLVKTWTLMLVGAVLLHAPAGAEEERARIAVLPVVVHSSDSRGYLREGLADMVTSRLEQIDTLDVVRVDDPEQATTRATEARERGREVEADYVLFGSFTRFGEGASLDMQCIAVDEEEGGLGPNRQIFVQSGNIGDVIPDLDNLVGKISRFAGGGGASDGEGGPDGGVAPSAPVGPGSLADLRRRVEALEAALGTERPPTPAPGPVAGPALPPSVPPPTPTP